MMCDLSLAVADDVVMSRPFHPLPPHPSYSNTHKVFVKMLSTGKTIALDVELCDTVEVVKLLIQAKEGISSVEQNIAFAGSQLENGEVLVEKHVVQDSTLELTCTLRGGNGGVEVSWVFIVGYGHEGALSCKKFNFSASRCCLVRVGHFR